MSFVFLNHPILSNILFFFPLVSNVASSLEVYNDLNDPMGSFCLGSDSHHFNVVCPYNSLLFFCWFGVWVWWFHCGFFVRTDLAVGDNSPTTLRWLCPWHHHKDNCRDDAGASDRGKTTSWGNNIRRRQFWQTGFAGNWESGAPGWAMEVFQEVCSWTPKIIEEEPMAHQIWVMVQSNLLIYLL